jgi:hypothetical protein
VGLSLGEIVKFLPDNLRPQLVSEPSASAVVMIQLTEVLQQLKQGSVRVSFGELRQGAPPGVFANTSALDSTMVQIPLSEVLKRIDPSKLPRRTQQKRIEVPEDIINVFGERGEIVVPPPNSASAEADRLRPAPVRPSVASTPAPAPISASSPPPPPVKPAGQPPAGQSSPARVSPPSEAASGPIPASASLRAMAASTGARAGASPSASPAAPAAADPEVAGSDPLTVPVGSVSEGWPEAIRQELGALNAEKSLIALPVGEVGAALKMGKVAFAWKQIRAWLNPAPQPGPSPHDAAILELPLNMIAPLFMAKRKPVASRKAVAVDENIPDLFTADGVRPSLESTVSSVAPTPVAETPVPSAPAPIQAPTPQPAATSPPAGDPRSVPASIPGRQARDLGELFGQPAKKSWTPQEIVEGTVRMKGVGGALLVLPDGLLVAARVPEGFRTETVASLSIR